MQENFHLQKGIENSHETSHGVSSKFSKIFFFLFLKFFFFSNNLFKCELCGTSFLYKTNYTHHIKTHGVAGGKTIPCEICGKNFSTEVTLKNHQARAHEIGIKCDTCKAPMASRDEMLQHLMTIHGPVQCQTCGATFIEPRKLKVGF